MADICQKHNLNYEVEEIFAAQNKNKAQPGVVVLVYSRGYGTAQKRSSLGLSQNGF